MQSIGETLRGARVSKGITLDQAEEDTKIRKRYLQALEDDDYDIIPGLVYAKGFLRNYANYLGLNPEEIMIEYKLLSLPPKEQGPRPDIEETISRRRASNRSNRRTYMATVAVALLALATFAVYGMVEKKAGDTPPADGNAKPVTAENNPTADNAKAGKPKNDANGIQNNGSAGAPGNGPEGTTANASSGTAANGSAVTPGTASSTNSPTLPAQNVAGTSSDGQVKIVLKGLDEACWTRVTVDGQVVFSGQIKPGETKTYAGTNTIKFRLGNAGAVDVNVNDQELGVLGQKGSVVDKEFSVVQ